MSLAIQVTNPYVDGMTLTGAILQSEFSTLIAKVNNLDDDNISASAAIALSKLASVAWTSYTPTWTATTANPAIGNGTITGRYIKIGRLVRYAWKITAGSTTTFGTGNYNVSLPLTNATNSVAFYNTGVAVHSGSVYTMSSRVLSASQVDELFVHRPITGTHTEFQAVSSTIPFTFASGDTLEVTGCYEAAA